MMQTWKHVTRGTLYREVDTAILQTAHMIGDGTELVAYRSEADGQLWVRPTAEFHDGRFERFGPLVLNCVGEVRFWTPQKMPVRAVAQIDGWVFVIPTDVACGQRPFAAPYALWLSLDFARAGSS